MSLIQWLDTMRWINGVGLVCHRIVGYFTKYSHKQIVKPIWNQNKEMLLITMAIYLVGTIIPRFLIYLDKKIKVNRLFMVRRVL